MGLKSLLTKVRCYFTSSCCKGNVIVEVKPTEKVITPSLSDSVFKLDDYKLYYDGDGDDDSD